MQSNESECNKSKATNKAQDEKVEALCSKLQETPENLSNREKNTNFKAKIGVTKEDHEVREAIDLYGLGERNARGDRLLHFPIETL